MTSESIRKPQTDSADEGTRSARTGLWMDLALMGSVALLGLVLWEPGVFTVDESHYLLACQALAERGDFQIQNGFESIGDPTLLYFYTAIPDRVSELGTVATVPPFHAVLAAPFFWLAGLAGLVWLNLLSFGLCLVAVRRLAYGVFSSEQLAMAAACVFGLATCSLEYAFGIWPHALSQALMAWALLSLLAAGRSRGSLWLILAAGLLGGVATGVRLQNVVLLPLMLVAARFCLGLGWRHLGLHLLGWTGPLMAMAAINAARLDAFHPLTYGIDEVGILNRTLAAVATAPWLAVLAVGALGAAFWLWIRTRRLTVWVGFGLLALVAAVLVPATRALMDRWIHMLGFHLLDTAFAIEPSASVGARLNDLGQSLYGGVLKKGLFQAVPFVALGLLTLLPRRRETPATPADVRTLATIGIGGMVLLPFVLSPGGLCYNPRYLLEVLVPLSLVAFWWAHQLGPGRSSLLVGALVGVVTAAPLFLRPGSVDEPSGGWLAALLPLGLTVAMLTGSCLALVGPATWRKHARWLAGALAGAAVVYAGLVHLRVDLSTSLRVRGLAGRMAAEARHVIPEAPAQSVLLAWEARKDVFSPLKLDRDVWIGRLGRTDRRAPLVARAAAGQRRIFVLANGVPPDRMRAWFGDHPGRMEKRKGLLFVEIEAARPPP